MGHPVSTRGQIVQECPLWFPNLGLRWSEEVLTRVQHNAGVKGQTGHSESIQRSNCFEIPNKHARQKCGEDRLRVYDATGAQVITIK